MGRTPQGVRGLKFEVLANDEDLAMSHPARGAWIEILSRRLDGLYGIVAPRKGCVD